MTSWKMTVSTFAMGLAAVALVAAAPASAKVEGDTITIGSAISFSGKYSTNGIHASNGYNLAAKVINERGGVKVGGKSYMIKQDGIKYTLGPYSSPTTIAAAPIVEQYKIPMVEAEGASRSLFTQGYKYLFAVLSTSEQYLRSAMSLAAELAEKEGRKPSDLKVAMVFENDAFSQDVRAGVVEDAQRLGMQIVIDDKMPPDLSDISPTLTKVKAVKPDVLVLSGHSKGAATGARQIKEMQIQVPLIGMTHCEAADIIGKFGAATEGFLCPTQWAETLSYKDEYFGSAADYDALFKATYPEYKDKSVPYQAAQASAAVLVWKDAFERANSFDTEKVRDALAATKMQTFYGRIEFAEAGNNIAKPMVLRQVQDGKLNVVAPTAWASHPVSFPREVMY
jgi:branched-chain amino acid transport system substrate-binding protein